MSFNTMKSPPQAIPDGGRELEFFVYSETNE